MSSSVELKIGGDLWTGWKSVSITMSLEAVANSFSVVTRTRDPWLIRAGSTAELYFEGKLILRGFVDQVAPSYDDGGSMATITGRSRTADLVDCSADTEPGEWWNARPQDVIREVVRPYGISLIDSVGELERILVFRIQPGESAYEAIERICRMRALLAMATAGGDLLLTRPDPVWTGAEVREGVNVKSSSATEDFSERYAEYIVRAQTFGTDDNYGPPALQIEGRAFDPAIRSSRKILITPESTASRLSAHSRAMWEATVRKARSLKVSVAVVGWKQPSGSLWIPNLRVQAELPSLRISGQMLVSTVRLELGEGGSTGTMELMQPDSFIPQPDLDTTGNPFADLVAQEEED